jgi:hypothetical protein
VAASLHTSVRIYLNDIVGGELNLRIGGLLPGNDWLVDGAVKFPGFGAVAAARIE